MSSRLENKQFTQDNAFGLQLDWPLFVKVPFHAFGKDWKKGEYFNWIHQKYRGEDQFLVQMRIKRLYDSGFVRHDRKKEVKNKVGDRLSEMNTHQLYSLVAQLNMIVKDRTSSSDEYQKKKCKTSKIDDKQRGLIRQFIRKNPWITDDFYSIRDVILSEHETK